MDDSDISGMDGGVGDVGLVSGDVSDGACERGNVNVAASGVNVVAYIYRVAWCGEWCEV